MNKTIELIQNNTIFGLKVAPDAIARAVQNYQKTEGKNFGELHQEGELLTEAINLKNVSHAIKNIRIEENSVLADIEILDTPSGRVLSDIWKLHKVYPRVLVTGNIFPQIDDITIITFDLGL